MSSLYSHWFFGGVVFLKPTFFVNFFLSVHSISQVRHTPTSRAALQSQTLVRRRDFPVPTLLGSVGEVEQVHPNAVYEHMTGYHVFNSHWAWHQCGCWCCKTGWFKQMLRILSDKPPAPAEMLKPVLCSSLWSCKNGRLEDSDGFHQFESLRISTGMYSALLPSEQCSSEIWWQIVGMQPTCRVFVWCYSV